MVAVWRGAASSPFSSHVSYRAWHATRVLQLPGHTLRDEAQQSCSQSLTGIIMPVLLAFYNAGHWTYSTQWWNKWRVWEPMNKYRVCVCAVQFMKHTEHSWNNKKKCLLGNGSKNQFDGRHFFLVSAREPFQGISVTTKRHRSSWKKKTNPCNFHNRPHRARVAFGCMRLFASHLELTLCLKRKKQGSVWAAERLWHFARPSSTSKM